MAQMNLHITPEFERALRRFMRVRGLTNKSEAIRAAVREAAERDGRAGRADFRSWVGAGCAAPLNPRPRFTSDDDLWR